MMKPLFFMGYTPAPDPMRISLFLVWRGQIPPTRTSPYFYGVHTRPRPYALSYLAGSVRFWLVRFRYEKGRLRGRRSPDKKERNHRSTGHTDRDRKNHTYPDTVTP